MRYAILALPAVLCSLVVAIPSPAAQNDPNLHLEQEQRIPRWRTFTNRIVERVFGFDKKHGQKHIHLPKHDAPMHMFARYGGDLVLRFNISTNEEAESLAEAADTLLLDVWEFSQDWVDIRLDRESVPLLLGLLPARLQVSHTPLLREKALAEAIYDNYQRHSSRPAVESPAHVPTRKPFGPELEQETAGAETNIFFSDYQPFSVIEPWLHLLASLFTTHVRHINVGLSYEGRNIPALRVGVHPTNSDDLDPVKRKTIIVVGSLHAREWISTTTVNYLAYSLITGYGKLQSITNLLEDFDFVFIPTLNPDGYVYTWETDRLWRKNRQQTGIRFCQGIDLDRAFSFEWEDSGNPCSESYSGEAAFEAVEAATFAEWAKNETENNDVDFVGFLDLHSYSQEILYPYSYSCSDTPPGLENLEEVAFGLGKAIRMTHSHSYEIMPACEGNVGVLSSKDPQQKRKKNHLMPRIEPSGGSALDYFYHSLGVRYAYQIKLRDRGTYGFLLPKENIVPTGKEILNALLYFGGFLGELYDTDSKSIELIKPDFDTVEDEVDFALTEDDEEIEDDDDEPWIIVEDVRESDDYNWDLRRRRRR